MSRHNYKFRDDAFNPDEAYSYVLVIQAANEVFSYAVVYNNYLVAWEKNCTADRLDNTDEILDARYKKVIIGLVEQGFTLIPDSTFNPDQVEHIARFLDVKNDEKVYSQTLDSHNQVIYKTRVNLPEKLKTKYPDAAFTFCSKGWITEIAKNDPSYRSLYLNLADDKLEILNFKNGRLRFYNTFTVKTAEDIIYFATVAAAEVQMPPQTVKLILSGDKELMNEYDPVLSLYFGGTATNDVKPVNLPAAIVPEQVLSIAALSLCAS